MTVTAERDDRRIEVRQSVAEAVTLYPKIDGRAVVVSSGTWVVYGPDGSSVGSGSVTPADVGSPAEYSSIALTIPAIATLGENYRLEVSFVVSAATHLLVRLFDVVLYPFDLEVSSNDLIAIDAAAAVILARQGLKRGAASSTEGTHAAAGDHAYRAIQEIEARLKARIAEQSGTRPTLILDRELLARPARYLAVAYMFLEEASAAGAVDAVSAKYRLYAEMAETLWAAMPPLSFSGSEDLEVAGQTASFATIRMRRSW